MPLNTNAALLQLDPLAPLKLDLGSKKQASMERERLQLMREQFEEAKRQNAEDKRLREMEEAGRTTRERMQTERQAEHDAAVAAAELLKKKREAHDAMLAYEDAGDFEGMNNAANVLNELGGRAEMTGQDEGGFPTWQVDLDREEAEAREAAQEAQAAPGELVPQSRTKAPGYGRGPKLDETAVHSLDRLGALGFPTNERGPVAPGAGIGSSDDMTPEQLARVTGGGQADRAATDAAVAQPPLEVERDIGPPAPDYDADENPIRPEFRKPVESLDPLGSLRPKTLAPAPVEQPDLMGSVPKNVIDTGAMAAQTKQRLGPVMASIEASMPPAYRESTRHNNEAATSMGLPADKAAALSLQLRAPANAAIKDELDAQRDREKEERALVAKADDPKVKEELHNFGLNRARDSFKDQKVDLRVSGMERADEVVRMLTNQNTADDAYAINKLMVMDEQSGAQSNADALRLSGGETLSTIDQAKAWIHKQIEGGYWDKQKAAMLEFARSKRASYRDTAFAWVEAQQEAADAALHPLSRAGRLEFLESLPDWFLKEHNEGIDDDPAEPDAEQGAARSGASSGAAPAIEGEVRIPEESRIAFVHNNPGNLMFDKDNPAGAEVGEPKQGGGNWARFPTVDAGLEALRGWIERNEDKTLREFFSKYAPASDGNDTERYVADAATALGLSPDDAVYDADVYDVMRFITQHESSTVLPDIYANRRAKAAALDARDGPNPDLSRDTPVVDDAAVEVNDDEPPAADPAERVKQLLRKAQR